MRVLIFQSIKCEESYVTLCPINPPSGIRPLLYSHWLSIPQNPSLTLGLLPYQWMKMGEISLVNPLSPRILHKKNPPNYLSL